MKQPCFWNLVNRMWQPVRGEPPKFIDNIKAHLENPGQFYFDRAASSIFYVPLPGQNASHINAVVALEETLLTHDTSSRHAWEGVTFEYATWLRPGQGAGFVEQQSCTSYQTNVRVFTDHSDKNWPSISNHIMTKILVHVFNHPLWVATPTQHHC